MAKKQKRTDRQRSGFLFDEGAGDTLSADDLFSDTEADEPAYGEADEPAYGTADEPDYIEADEAADEPSEEGASEKAAPSFTFDRYGRRIGRKNERYGKRKNAPKATTTVVEHDTAAKREYDEARARAEERAKKRAKEEANRAAVQKAERAKQRRRSLSTALFGIFGLALLLVMGWFVTRVTTIRVANVPDGYTEEQIITLSRLKKGRSILFQSTESAEKAIRTDPYLDASVQYSFPSTIRIAVTKRTEAACVRWGPQNEYLAIIDENGIVLNAQAETSGNLLIADGMNISSAVGGARLGDSTDTQVAALVRVLTKLKELGLLTRSPRISRIDMTELMQIRMYTEGTSYTIEVGDSSNLDTKLMLLQKHWDTIMQKAADYVHAGHNTPTIYLYSKGGVSVSPFEPGYVKQDELPSGTPAPGDGEPTDTAAPDGEPTGGEPNETPQPEVTPMPHQDEPFTG